VHRFPFGGGMRDPHSILLIDDERLLVETLKGNFQASGYHIVTARNGEEGVRQFQNNRFDLVITGQPDGISSDQSSRSGIRDFVIKPFTWEQMLKKVTDCLEPRLNPSSSSELNRGEPKSRKDPYQFLSQFLSGQNRVIEMVTRGEPIKDILTALTSELELCSEGILGSVHLVNNESKQLSLVAAPSLFDPILKDIGSLGLEGYSTPWSAAVAHNKPILIEDILKNSLWERDRNSANICGLRASWSFPLRRSDQKVAGVLTFYSRTARSPSSAELKWILSATRLFGVLLEFKPFKGDGIPTDGQGELPSEKAREGVLTFNSNGEIESFNPTASKLFGYPGNTLIGRSIKHLITERVPIQNSSSDKVSPGILKAAAKGYRRDGSSLYLNVSVDELAHPSGRKFIATVSDMSHQKYGETVLREAQKKIEELNESATPPTSLGEVRRKFHENGEGKSEALGTEESQYLQKQLVQSEKWAATGKLAASLAHEFKNPLFGILNVLEKAARKISIKQGSDDLLELAIRECYRVMDLVEKMQDVHRPSSHSPEPVDLNLVIKDMVLLTRPPLRKRNIRLVMDLDPRLPKNYVIEDQIKQVVLNMLNNAGEAITGPDGKIAVRTRVMESSMKIVIQDNGKGIPENRRQKIFEPFFTTKQDSGGMGLGLPVSSGIIKAHGGRIDVETGIGGSGTSFIITLPKRLSRRNDHRPEDYLTVATPFN
jgi:PAS domain S-box-containing protein